MSAPDPPFDVTALHPFLERHGFPAPCELIRIPGGANNQVYRVQAGERRAVLKRYYHNADDPRDRYHAEASFYRFLEAARVGQRPESIAWDPLLRVGLFEWIEGSRLQPAEVSRLHLSEACAFVEALEKARSLPEALQVPEASEACFSIHRHLATIGGRVQRLEQLRVETELERRALDFVQRRLKRRWNEVHERILDTAPGGDKEVLLATGHRCLSPSDFGFHNALLDPRGHLRFLDFEYAGWDDPAKLTCDFLCQPEVPVPRHEAAWFAASIQAIFKPDDSLPERTRLLLPAYQVKWCCILLNDFAGGDRRRRAFALDTATLAERQERQLARAEAALENPFAL